LSTIINKPTKIKAFSSRFPCCWSLMNSKSWRLEDWRIRIKQTSHLSHQCVYIVIILQKKWPSFREVPGPMLPFWFTRQKRRRMQHWTILDLFTLVKHYKLHDWKVFFSTDPILNCQPAAEEIRWGGLQHLLVFLTLEFWRENYWLSELIIFTTSERRHLFFNQTNVSPLSLILNLQSGQLAFIRSHLLMHP